MLRKSSIICAAIFLLITFLPDTADAAPNLATKFFCLVDGDTGQIIYGQGENDKRAVASTTKMMTAILTVEYAELDEIANITKHAEKTPEFTIGLRAGQEVEVGELLKVALIRSANDAAVALAEHVAGEERLFGHLMTKKAFAIGSINTHFVNASGLPNSEHYSTAYDLSVIGRYLLSKEEPARIVALAETKYKHPSYSQPLTIQNTNGLIWGYKGVNGIKTGTTNLAGKCLVVSAAKDGRSLVAVVLKSGNRNGDGGKLLDYGFNKANYEKIIDKQEVFKQLKIENGTKEYVEIYPGKDLSIWQGDMKLDIEKRVHMKYEINAPIKKGREVGYIDIFVNNKYVERITLISGEDIGKDNIIHRIKKIFIK